eukprot:CAMPEP_0194184892 /NCGR_PEP_ID=MMETSP0154-20130528/40142_1 /TAXON_ID=1049557 /ORGANISM="Thalassiothrix antarctica, Strain L6-D1" /LENGTH=95 /DNA_ID=CAMNT_0038902863 /DNA_START=17 /DNA_END=300 /DNA_ORIENTATION=+
MKDDDRENEKKDEILQTVNITENRGKASAYPKKDRKVKLEYIEDDYAGQHKTSSALEKDEKIADVTHKNYTVPNNDNRSHRKNSKLEKDKKTKLA